ncbi:ester cyclase [Novosphingobium terrae]|uniref:ester cyclase n=1 Tax=Novosphingobium terrae TaxID=2726189 RepID=UPI00197DD334|nr:ester cyclase [Novosphingobium terrae]
MEATAQSTANKDLADAFFRAVDRLDRATLDEIYHKDFSLDYPGNDTPMDRDAHWALMNGYHKGFPDMIHRPDVMVAEGDHVFVQGTVTGTNSGPLLGQEPTGAFTKVRFLNMMTFREGKLLSIFSLIDQATLQKQLGLKKVLFVAE